MVKNNFLKDLITGLAIGAVREAAVVDAAEVEGVEEAGEVGVEESNYNISCT